MAECPVGRRNVLEHTCLTIGGGDLERQGLAVEVGIGLPVSTPVSRHRHPPGLGALDGDRLDRAAASHVADQDQLKVVSAVDGESHSTMFLARNPVKKKF